MSGGFNPSPNVLGGSAALDLEAIQEGFADSQGSALARERGTVAWVENHAQARVLWDLYRLPQRLANQWDPLRMTDFLPRWEKILGIKPLKNETLLERREHVGSKMSLVSAGTIQQVLTDYLEETIGDIFVGVEYGDPVTAVTYVPGGASIPGGPTLLDGDLLPNTLSPWSSSLAYISILINKPASMTNDEFYERAARIYDDVDNLIGAWMRFDWVNDGPNGAGFYLDEDANLDNQRFDE